MTPQTIFLTTFKHQHIHLLIASQSSESDAKLLAIAHIDASNTDSLKPQILIDSASTKAWLATLKIYHAFVERRLLDTDSELIFINPINLSNATNFSDDNQFSENSLSDAIHAPAIKLLRMTMQQLEGYFIGSRQHFDLPLDLSHGTEFQRQVWQTLQAIEYGQTMTYAELATQVGNPKAVRAVANANGKNLFSIVVPCHRVIASDGGLGGYTGGVHKKQQLLDLEKNHCNMMYNTDDAQVSSFKTSKSISTTSHIHVVLVHPDIPNNTGNIIRLCANTGAILHLVKPLGFELEDKKLRRAGLDYHEYANLQVHEDWQSAKDSLSEFGCQTMVGLTTKLSQPFYEFNFVKNMLKNNVENMPSNIALVFGSETAGLPEIVRADIGAENWLRLPMLPHSRSLNLSNSVAICLYEVWRQLRFVGDEGQSEGYDVPNHLSQ